MIKTGKGKKLKKISLLLLFVLISSIFVGCASSSKGFDNAESIGSPPQEGPTSGYSGGEQDIAPAEAAEARDDGSLAGGPGFSKDAQDGAYNSILAERKVIRSANISIEVDSFDDAYAKINNLILGIGYIQNTNISTDKVYVDKEMRLVKHGTVVIRVDKERFDTILNSIQGIGEVRNWSINGEDITDKYIDIESRIRLLKLEERKIEEYLEKLTDLDQIFKYESRLTEIRYQIESYTGNLNKLAALVELSTITINMDERYPDSASHSPTGSSYGARLLNSLKDSFKNVIDFTGELIIILVSLLPVLILLGIIAVVAVLIYRKTARRRIGKRENEDDKRKNKDEDLS